MYNNYMPPLNTLTVFFPAYNEEDNIVVTVQHALEVLPSIAQEYEVLIINDGSKDRTGEVADELARKYSAVKVLHHPQNKGYGGALKTGMYNALYEIVAFTDSDGQFDFAQIDSFIPYIKDYDIVIGYRTNRAEGFRRHLNATAWGILVRYLFGIEARDIDCAFKVFHKNVLKKMPELESDGAMISAEFLMKAHRSKCRIKEVPVNHFLRRAGKPTGANIGVIIKAFKELFVLKKKLDAQYSESEKSTVRNI